MELPTTRSKSLFAIDGGFHLPYLPFIGLISPETYGLIHDLQIPFIVLLGLGIVQRLSAGVLLGLQGYIFFSDQLHFRNHPYFFLLVLLLLIFSPAGESFSVRALFRRVSRGARGAASAVEVVAPLTVQRLIQFQVSVVYFFSALHKLTDQYLDGQVLAQLLAPAILNGRVGQMLTSVLSVGTLQWFQASIVRPEFWIIAAWATVLLELTLPFALWIPRVRVAAMLLGIPFHLMIAYSMRVETFSTAMIATYLLFLDPDTTPRVWRQVRDRVFGQPKRTRRAKGQRVRQRDAAATGRGH